VISAPTAGNDRARERVLGIRATLQGHGLSLEPERLVELPISLSGGQEGMRRLLDGRKRPTAVICINDVLAVGAIAQCRVSGLTIPGDVSVAGFGDMEIAALHSPGITTVRSPTLEMGRVAAGILVARLEEAPVESHVELEAPLVVRGSTGAPPALPRGQRS
jgi:LacI family transcriptional regulator